MRGEGLKCGLSKDANTFILLGHSCDFIGSDMPIMSHFL